MEGTLDSYGATGFKEVPGVHWDFLAGTLRYHETEHDFFVQANVRPDLPLEDQPDCNLFWEHIGGGICHVTRQHEMVRAKLVSERLECGGVRSRSVQRRRSRLPLPGPVRVMCR